MCQRWKIAVWVLYGRKRSGQEHPNMGVGQKKKLYSLYTFWVPTFISSLNTFKFNCTAIWLLFHVITVTIDSFILRGRNFFIPCWYQFLSFAISRHVTTVSTSRSSSICDISLFPLLSAVMSQLFPPRDLLQYMAVKILLRYLKQMTIPWRLIPLI